MITIKLMKRGDSWIGEMRSPVVPRVGEFVEMGNQKTYQVEKVVYEFSHDGHRPFVILTPN